MWGSRVILPALLLTLDEYSSWRVGRVVPIIHSAVWTILCILLRSDLVAEMNKTQLNQTSFEVQRTDSMMAVYKCISSSCGRLNFLRWRRKYNLCWAVFTMESMWVSHFRSCEMVLPRNMNVSTVITVLFMMVSGRSDGGFCWSPRSSPLFWACWAPGCWDCSRQPAP